jgi:hypothetical protein
MRIRVLIFLLEGFLIHGGERPIHIAPYLVLFPDLVISKSVFPEEVNLEPFFPRTVEKIELL